MKANQSPITPFRFDPHSHLFNHASTSELITLLPSVQQPIDSAPCKNAALIASTHRHTFPSYTHQHPGRLLHPYLLLLLLLKQYAAARSSDIAIRASGAVRSYGYCSAVIANYGPSLRAHLSLSLAERYW